MNFQELKNKIIAWFWKMGYKLGNAVGLLGKGLVDEAFSAGFRDTAFQQLNIDSLLNEVDASFDADIAAAATLTTADDISDLASLDFKSVFAPLFEEHFQSADSIFSSNDWSVQYGTYSAENGFVEDQTSLANQTHARYFDPSGSEEVIIELSRDDDGNIKSAGNSVVYEGTAATLNLSNTTDAALP